MAASDDRDEHNPGDTSVQRSGRRKAVGEPGAVEETSRADLAPLPVPDTGSLIALNRRQPPVPLSTAPTAPDALEPDRILELPVRRQTARREPETADRVSAPRPPVPDADQNLRSFPAERRAESMASLREAAQPYLTRLAAKRRTSATDVTDTNGQLVETPKGSRVTKPLDPPDLEVCPLCHGAGFVRLDVPVGDKLFGQAVRCECKEREIEERERQKLRDLSSLKPFEKKTFATFETSVPGVAEACEVARRYADDPNGWLIFQGGYGCGKTHLAAAIAHVREAAGETVFFSIAPDLLDHLRATFAPNSEITYDDLFDRVRHVGLLVLDDLGSENSTAWATEKLFQIINYRYNYRLPTVITTNVRLLSHLDDRIRSRLGDIGLVRWVVMNAPDYRERHTGSGDGARPPRSPRGRGYAR